MNKQTVYHISTFEPTQCGIATYTEDLIAALPHTRSLRLRMQYAAEKTVPGFDNAIIVEDLASYEEAVRRINASDASVVSLQHEYGIFGGRKGSYVTYLMDHIEKPIVTTLHALSPYLTPEREAILKKIIDKSQVVIVLTHRSKHLLVANYNVSPDKIQVIYHGVPDLPFQTPDVSELRKEMDSPLVFFSSGHLRYSKGYTDALKALGRLKASIPDFKYLILGTHQEQHGESERVRSYINEIIDQCDLRDNLIWLDRYLPQQTIIDYINASDIGLVTYKESTQSSSGVMPMILSCGRPVIATSFDYALDVHAHLGDGVRIAEVSDDESLWDAMMDMCAPGFPLYPLMEECYAKTRPWVWARTGQAHERLFRHAAAETMAG